MQLFCGDCMEFMDHIDDGSVDMVLMDPPYSSGECLQETGRGAQAKNTVIMDTTGQTVSRISAGITWTSVHSRSL